MKKTFLILLVLFCVASIGIASVSAASDDLVSDDADAVIALDDNAIDEISSTDSGASQSDSIPDMEVSDSGADDKTLGASPLNDGTNYYVSTTGDDSKDGLSEENAVATISKAVELAGDGDTINIANGEYVTAAIDLPASKSLSFIGAEKDGVTIKGTGNYVIGLVESGSSLVFKNLIFTGVDATAGTSTGLRVGGNSPLEVSNCTFTNINAKYGGLYVYTSNVAKITDCTFKDISCSATGGAAAVYMTNGDVTFDKCIFDGFTYTPSAGYIYGVFYQTNGNLTIANSIVKNTDAYAYAVLRTSKLNTYLINTTFIDNIVKPNPNSYNNFGEAILQAAGASAHLTVEGCNFVENQARFGVVQVQRTFGNISHSAFLDNTLVEGEGDLLAINASSSYSKEIYADYNYYGSNDNPSNLVSGVEASNWVIMSAEASADSVAVGDEITITADFSKYTDGTTTSDLTGTMAEVPVKFTNDDTKGTISDITYENNKVIVTYTGVAEGADTVAVTAGQSISIPITVIAGGPVASPIYVAKDGDDENAGTEDAPVATVTKAVALATAEGGSGKVIIKEGTYTESGIVINGDLDISTVGDVILNGNGARYFDIQSGDVSIANVTMTNCNNSYGGAVIRVTGGSLSIEDSFIIANGGEYRDNLIRVTGASLTLINTVFENNTAHRTSPNYGGVYISDGVLIVDGCTFKDNFNKYGQIYVTGSSIGSVAVINNTQFIGNNATSSSGGTGAGIYLGGTAAYTYSNGTTRPGATATVYVVGCEFINNSAKGGTYYAGQGGAIYVNNNATLMVSDSKFINNTCMDNTNGSVKSTGGAIFSSAGNVNVMNSIFENNIASEGSEIYMKAYGPDTTNLNFLNISNSIIKDDGDSVIVSNYTNGTLLANSNWWGSNEGPAGKVTEGITVDNWVIMNVEPSLVENALTGEAVEISIDFKHTNSTAGTITDLEGTLPQEFTVYGGIANGTIAESPVSTVDLEAKLIYTPEFAGENIVNVYTDLDNTVAVIIYATEPYTGPIYVSKDGDDANSGEEDSPVASIAKAIELANEGSGQIIINEGTYTETGFTVSKDLVITGDGDVVIDANNESAKVFTIAAGVSNFELNNVKITKANNNYGAVLYNNVAGSTVTLNNVTLTENVAQDGWSSTSVLYNSGANLIIKDSTIANHTVRGLIYNNGGNLSINNTVFENNNASSDSSAIMGAIYSTGAVNVAIENSNFSNTASRQGAVYVTGTDSNLTVSGSSFVNSNCEVGSGGAIHADSNLIVDSSKFINNTASRDGGAIYASKGANISNSVFIGGISNTNEYGGYDGDEIAASGDLTLNNNIILKTEGSSNKAVKVSGSGTVDVNSNWWGSNDNPASLITGAVADNWVIMNVDPSVVMDSEIGSPVTIKVDFKHTNSTTGEIADLTGTLPEEITVYASAENGTLSANSVSTSDLEAQFTYAPEFAGTNNVILSTDASNAVTVTVYTSEAYNGPIYVSTSGDDENSGSPDAPVATIAKAVELASSKTGEIIITEGTYTENGILINSTSPISITGEGNAIIDASGLATGSMFTLLSGDIAFKNLVFKNSKARYGGAIYTYGQNANNLLELNMLIDNCTFDGLNATSRGGAIYTYYTSGNLIINNTKFINCYASSWGGAVCTAYSAYADALDLVIDNCNFVNNSANNGGAGYLHADTISITNSNFTENNATYYPGALELYNCTATIDNCIFANNSGKSQGTAIKIEAVSNQPIATLSITNSIIEDNYGTDGKAPAIFVDRGTLDISYSSIVNEHDIETKTATGYDAIYGQGIAIANNNWWGTNDPTTVVNGTNITIDKWVIMNVEANASDVQAGDEVKLTVDFNHVNTTAGEIEELTGGVIPKESYTVVFTAENGTVAPATIEVASGASGEAIFTAEGPNAIVTATCEDAATSIIFEGEIPEPYTGIVYVSKDGDDANNGSEDAPVASIAKAIEIATAESGSGQIIIKEGTYTGTEYLVTKDLSIIGEGNVVIDGEGLGKLFYMEYGAEVNKFLLANVTLTGANSGYGAAVYSYAKETVLDNVTIINNPGAGDLITTNGNVTIKDSLIRGHDGGDVIQVSGDVTIVINNTSFENNVVAASSSDYGVIYVFSGKGNLIIEDSKFINNTAKQGIIVGAYDTNITVKGCEFIDNTNTLSYGGAIRSQAKLDVTESVFINNNAYRGGGAIYVGFRGDATITKSEFINNSAGTGYYGDAIYNGNKLTANYNIFLSDGTNYIIYNDGEDNVVNAQYNWWGTNDDPKDLNGKGYYEDDYWEEVDCADVDSSNWIIMNVETDLENVQAGEEVPIAVDFNHYIDANGDIQELADSLAQELDVSFITTTGSFDNNEVTTVDQVATGIYTVAEGMNNITVKSSDASVNIEFGVFTDIETTVSVSAESVWTGNPVEITVNVADEDGNAVEGTVTISINGLEETIDLSEGAATYTIPADKLNAGENTVTVAYNGLGQYLASEGSATFNVLDGVVTKDTFQYYFDAENNYTLFDYVPEGATLDFQGDFIGAYTTNINKPVNIVSTTGDAFIETNKTGSFNILAGGSGTNVSGLSFLNTAFYITTAHDVVVDNIRMVANMTGVGSGTGFMCIRQNSEYVTVKNSYFENGGTGSSCLVIGTSSHCAFDHNIINATYNAGNLIYITTYVGTGATPTYNNITNNVIESVVNSGFCYAIAVIGGYNLIENNTINHPGSGIVQQSVWGGAPSPNGYNTYINNTLTGGCGMTVIANSTAINNTVAGAMTLQGDVTAEGNTANSLTINGANCIVKDNTINGAVTVAKAAKNTQFTDNVVTGLVTVNSDANTITGNDIRTSTEYAIDLKTGANNTVTDNTLYASEKVGDAAVQFTEGKDNTVKENYPLSTTLTVVVDDAITGEPSNVNVKLVDSKGQGVTGTVQITIGEDVYNVTVTDGKGSVAIGPFEETGTVDIVASFEDEAYAPSSVEATVTVYGPGNVTVKHTDAGDAADIQAAIDAANPGDVVQLGNYDYTDVADVNITKDVTIAGTEGTTITSTGDGTPIFNVPAKSEDGPSDVSITGVDFKLNNGDTVVKAVADNGTSPLAIDTASISITDNTFELADESVVPESVTVLELESERGSLAPTGEISIADNTLEAGVSPFKFDVTSATSGSNANIPVGGDFPEKLATVIEYEDMNTTAIDSSIEPGTGKYFEITLKDSNGVALANKDVQFGFNGKIYNKTTDDQGIARLQINLQRADIYTFAVSFQGDDQYNGSFAVAKITVKKQTPTLTVPNKSYKASAKTKTLTATFKSASGKVVANKKVSFTVNGKTYTATTNDKGVASVNVSLSDKKTYSFTAKFAGDNTYAAITKTAKLTIN